MNSTPPYATVRVNFSNSDYQNVCDDFGGGFDRWPAWRDLGNLLAHRPGWHFDVVNGGEALWCLGVLGESLLTVFVNEDLRYHCCDHARDEDLIADDTSAVQAWLEEREDEAKKPSRTLIAMASDANWKYFTLFPFQLRVSWSDGYFAAHLPNLAEPSFGRSLAEAVNGTAEMICQLFGAPPELAPQLTIALELDTAASQKLRTDSPELP